MNISNIACKYSHSSSLLSLVQSQPLPLNYNKKFQIVELNLKQNFTSLERNWFHLWRYRWLYLYR